MRQLDYSGGINGALESCFHSNYQEGASVPMTSGIASGFPMTRWEATRWIAERATGLIFRFPGWFITWRRPTTLEHLEGRHFDLRMRRLDRQDPSQATAILAIGMNVKSEQRQWTRFHAAAYADRPGEGVVAEHGRPATVPELAES